MKKCVGVWVSVYSVLYTDILKSAKLVGVYKRANYSFTALTQ